MDEKVELSIWLTEARIKGGNERELEPYYAWSWRTEDELKTGDTQPLANIKGHRTAAGVRLPLVGLGLPIMFPRKPPKAFEFWVGLLESDKGHRDFGKQLETVVGNSAVQGLAGLNPATAMVLPLGALAGALLRGNGDDLLVACHGGEMRARGFGMNTWPNPGVVTYKAKSERGIIKVSVMATVVDPT